MKSLIWGTHIYLFVQFDKITSESIGENELGLYRYHFRVSCQMSNFKFQMSNVKCQMSNVKCQMSNDKWQINEKSMTSYLLQNCSTWQVTLHHMTKLLVTITWYHKELLSERTKLFHLHIIGGVVRTGSCKSILWPQMRLQASVLPDILFMHNIICVLQLGTVEGQFQNTWKTSSSFLRHT